MPLPVLMTQTDAAHTDPPYVTEILHCHVHNQVWAAPVPIGTVYLACPFCDSAVRLREN